MVPPMEDVGGEFYQGGAATADRIKETHECR
jgi:hypothetical protein